MTYQVNPDGTVSVVKSKQEQIDNANAWKDYSKDLNQSENS